MMKERSTMVKSQQKIGYLMVLIAGILWGSIGFFVSFLKNIGAESSTIAFLRISIGAVLLIPLMYARGGKDIFKIDKEVCPNTGDKTVSDRS